jgi:hypothetical protein
MSTAKPITPRSRKPTDPDPRRRLQAKDMRKKFFLLLEKNGSRAASAAALGFHESTVAREMKRDGRFRANVEMCLRRFEGLLLKEHNKHEKKDFRAIEWRLERMFPDDYGKRDPGYATPEMLVELADRLLLKLMEVVPKEYHLSMMAVSSNLKTDPCEVGGMGLDLAEPFDDEPDDDGGNNSDHGDSHSPASPPTTGGTDDGHDS